MQEDIPDLVQTVKDKDPNSEKIIVFASAPPCPDFSRVCPDAPGKEGQEGRKFVEFCKFSENVKHQLPQPVKKMLCENVVLQDKGEISYFEKALGCSAVVLDSADFGLVSRPRLFWTDIQWDHQLRHPVSDRQLRWSKYQKIPQVHIDEGYMEVNDMEMDGYQLHPRVVGHSMVLPCFTTPAPTSAGRSAPKRMKGRLDPESKTMATRQPHLCTMALCRDSHGTVS